MTYFFVMRRANGEFFTESLAGVQSLPIWPGILTLEKYKIFNPELDLFLPAHLNDPRINSKLKSLEKSGMKFLLMTSDDPSPDLSDGTPTTLGEIESLMRPAA